MRPDNEVVETEELKDFWLLSPDTKKAKAALYASLETEKAALLVMALNGAITHEAFRFQAVKVAQREVVLKELFSNVRKEQPKAERLEYA